MRTALACLTLLLLPSYAVAAGSLELPSGRASGIGVVSGWKCPPVGNLTVEFNGGAPIPLAKGISRQDTSGVCGNSGLNGFIAQYNYNLLGTGRHTAVVRDDGVEFGRNEFDVQTFGVSFFEGPSGSCRAANFPSSGEETTLTWNRGQQNFVIVGVDVPPQGSIFYEDFEEGIGLSSVTNGVWEVGEATTGPGSCRQGISCAATVLDGDYPGYHGSSFVTRSIVLPTLGAAEELQLRFWGWHQYGWLDSGSVSVQRFDETTSTWSEAEVKPGSGVGGSSGVWGLKSVDLTSEAGRRIRILFNSVGDGFGGGAGLGWYIDEIEVLKIS